MKRQATDLEIIFVSDSSDIYPEYIKQSLKLNTKKQPSFFNWAIPSVGEDAVIAGGTVKWFSHSLAGSYIFKYLHLLYDPAIPLLRVFPGEVKT